MTTPAERTRTLKQTREFLQELQSATTPGVPDEVRRQARVLLRHFPLDADLAHLNLVLPNSFGELPDAQGRG